MKPDLYLKIDNHELAIYTKGDKEKTPILILHGGPGGSINEKSFACINEKDYYIVAFDQRGCGNSKPFASLHNNTLFDSVSDIEFIRKKLNIDKFIIFGGSYGTTLALTYAINYPNNVISLVLRGIFLGRDEDIKWLYQEGASYYFPNEYSKFRNFLPIDKQNDIVKGYYEIFSNSDEITKRKACKVWSDYEASLVSLEGRQLSNEITNNDISIALLECKYFVSSMFNGEDNYILNNCDKIKDIKTYIVHGRYDIDCRPIGAYLLKQKLNDCELYFPIAGHTPFDINNHDQLVEIFKALKKSLDYDMISSK